MKSIIAFLLYILAGRNSPDKEFSAAGLREIIREGDCVIEIGANKGGLTTLLSMLVGANGMVYAIEPNVLAYDLLRIAMRKRSNVVCFNLAIGAQKTTAYLSMTGPTDKSAALVMGQKGQVGLGTAIRVIPLDDFTSAMKLKSINALVVDAEGSEDLIMKGATRVLRDQQRLRILIELHPRLKAGVFSEVQRLLNMHGFHCKVLSKTRDTVTCLYQKDTLDQERESLA